FPIALHLTAAMDAAVDISGDRLGGQRQDVDQRPVGRIRRHHSVAQQLGGHRAGDLRSAALAARLPAAEEEEMVVNNRAADSGAELIQPQLILAGGEEISRIEFIVAHELEQVAVELVRAGFRDDVDAAAGSTSDLGGEHALGGLEFLNEFLADEIEPGLSAEV